MPTLKFVCSAYFGVYRKFFCSVCCVKARAVKHINVSRSDYIPHLGLSCFLIKTDYGTKLTIENVSEGSQGIDEDKANKPEKYFLNVGVARQPDEVRRIKNPRDTVKNAAIVDSRDEALSPKPNPS